MKYRLKKPLPFAKAGEILTTEITNRAGIKVYVQGETFSNNRESILIGYAKELIEEGWIEEVKPREFFIEITTDNYLVGVSDANGYGILPTPYSPIKTKVIKVREVLE